MKEETPLLSLPPPGREATYDFNTVTVWCISMSFVYCFIICGVVTVVLGATLEDLADNVGYEATEIGAVYVLRGLGSVFGSFISLPLFEYYPAVGSLIIMEVMVALVVALMPGITNLLSLHAAYFMIGVLTSIIQAGSMLLLRKFHKDNSGPWLGAFGASFVSAGIAVPGVQLITESLTNEYMIYMCIVLFGVLLLCLIPNIKEDVQRLPMGDRQPNTKDSQNSSPEETSKETPQAPHYWTELVIALMVFFAIGGGDSLTFYLETYVDTTDVIDPSEKAVLLLSFFVAATIGDFVGIAGLMNVSDQSLTLQAASIFIVGAVGLLLILVIPYSERALWIGVCLFGLCNAPSISYCFALANRLSYPSATSTSIIIMGLSLGVSFMPFFTACMWKHFDMPLALMWVGFLSSIVPIPLMLVAPSYSYLKTDCRLVFCRL